MKGLGKNLSMVKESGLHTAVSLRWMSDEVMANPHSGRPAARSCFTWWSRNEKSL